MNPLGMMEALLGAMDHSAYLQVQSNAKGAAKNAESVYQFTKTLRTALHNTFRYGQGTRDMSGPHGLTTEQTKEIVDILGDASSRIREVVLRSGR